MQVQPAAPIESLVFGRTVLKPEPIELHLRNTSPQELAVAQVDVRDAFVPFAVSLAASPVLAVLYVTGLLIK